MQQTRFWDHGTFCYAVPVLKFDRLPELNEWPFNVWLFLFVVVFTMVGIALLSYPIHYLGMLGMRKVLAVPVDMCIGAGLFAALSLFAKHLGFIPSDWSDNYKSEDTNRW